MPTCTICGAAFEDCRSYGRPLAMRKFSFAPDSTDCRVRPQTKHGHLSSTMPLGGGPLLCPRWPPGSYYSAKEDNFHGERSVVRPELNHLLAVDVRASVSITHLVSDEQLRCTTLCYWTPAAAVVAAAVSSAEPRP